MNNDWIKLSEEIHNVAKNQCDDTTSRIEVCVGCLNKFILEKLQKELEDWRGRKKKKKSSRHGTAE